jgi:6-phosphogluconate dehydrogenase
MTTMRSLSTALVLALFGGACSAAPDFAKELDTVRSWTATVNLADSESRAGAITHAFTARLLAAAAEEREQSRQSLQQAAHSDDERARARAAIDSLTSALQHTRRDAAGR